MFLTGDLRGIWLLEYLSLVVAVVCCFSALRRLFDQRSAMFGTCLLLVSFPLVLDGGNLTEEFGLSTQFAALYLFSRGVGRRVGLRPWLIIGFVAGCAVLLKPNLGGAVDCLWRGGRSCARRVTAKLGTWCRHSAALG